MVAPKPADRTKEQLAVLGAARADLAAGAYAQAQARADSVLRAGPPAEMRTAALVVAGDAAFGLGAYSSAAQHYREVLQADKLPAEAAGVALALGWAEVRLGRRDEARQAFLRVAREFPSDPRAPIGLVLGAELMVQSGETLLARRFLDRAVETYPSSSEVEVARLSRSVLAIREGRTEQALSDLRTLVKSGRASVPDERARLLRALAGAGTPAPEPHLVMTNRFDAAAGFDRTGRPEEAGSVAPAAALERFAAPFLDGAGDPETTPRVLHALALVGTEDQSWPEVEALTRHLVDRYPGYPASPDLLLQVGERAAAAREWPAVRTSYERLLARAPSAALTPKARVDFGEALLRTGDPASAQAELSRGLASADGGEAPRGLFLLAESHQALDQPREALAAHDRLRRSHPESAWAAEGRLPHARLLQHAIGQQKQARALLEEMVQRSNGDERTEASFRLGQVLTAEGDHTRALDWYMAAAYGTDQQSQWHRPALLGAGRSLQALKRTRAAQAVYRSVLPAEVGPEMDGTVEEPELAGEAAYRIAEIAREAGRSAEAAEMYLTAVRLSPGSPWRGRALVEAIRALGAIGDRASAERVSRMLMEEPPRLDAAAPSAAADKIGPVPARAPTRNGR